MENTVFYPLGVVLEFIQSVGLDISYAYDDLVFSEHNVFVIRFNQEQSGKLDLFFNKDCDPGVREYTLNLLKTAAMQKDMELILRGTYVLNEIPGKEELEIVFQDQ